MSRNSLPEAAELAGYSLVDGELWFEPQYDDTRGKFRMPSYMVPVLWQVFREVRK